MKMTTIEVKESKTIFNTEEVKEICYHARRSQKNYQRWNIQPAGEALEEESRSIVH